VRKDSNARSSTFSAEKVARGGLRNL
jgi:hypothetical protein